MKPSVVLRTSGKLVQKSGPVLVGNDSRRRIYGLSSSYPRFPCHSIRPKHGHRRRLLMLLTVQLCLANSGGSFPCVYASTITDVVVTQMFVCNWKNPSRLGTPQHRRALSTAALFCVIELNLKIPVNNSRSTEIFLLKTSYQVARYRNVCQFTYPTLVCRGAGGCARMEESRGVVRGRMRM
ncbi:uncharacterized protein EV420DRAFT_153505 [Desarmillaria tabescens]|uniref:Uncharacterized protein n=1 Tax=Armillaria tabescens TaxID=1929756 RepID=A0AA39MLD4_ARMTA|nr:uncharacterized protein EV420DRAFT_153505 [Desarmillaria tabescens]KAK0437974.1 hypothetical protein EV420DRAFT_153505 [Desarmillaria tabescens]